MFRECEFSVRTHPLFSLTSVYSANIQFIRLQQITVRVRFRVSDRVRVRVRLWIGLVGAKEKNDLYALRV